MFKAFAFAVGLGVVGMIVGSLIVWGAVSTWTELSTRWLNMALVMPALGLVGGLALVQDLVGESRGKMRALLALVAIPLCGFSNYLAFILTSRTWFADKIPAEHQSLIFQIMNPDVLPSFSTSSTTHSSSSTESWLMYLILGLVMGPIVVWITSRKG